VMTNSRNLVSCGLFPTMRTVHTSLTDPFGLYDKKNCVPQARPTATSPMKKVVRFEERDSFKSTPVYYLVQNYLDALTTKTTNVTQEQMSIMHSFKEAGLSRELVMALLLSQPLTTLVKMVNLLPYMREDDKIPTFYGLIHTSFMLSKFNMTLDLPERIVVVPEKEAPEEELITYEPTDLPRVTEDETLIMSSVIIDVYDADTIRPLQEDIRIVAAEKGIMPNVVTASMLDISIPTNLFDSDEPVAVTRESGNVLRQITKDYVDTIEPDEEIHVLYADGGNLLPTLANTRHRRFTLHFTTDYPPSHLTKKIEVVKNMQLWYDDRFVVSEHSMLMEELLKSDVFSDCHVLANYVPEAAPYKSSFRSFSAFYADYDGATGSCVLPDTVNAIRDYVKSAYAEKITKKERLSLLDRHRNIKATYDQHQVWVDKVTSVNAPFALRDVLPLVFNTTYAGSLKYDRTFRSNPVHFIGEADQQFLPVVGPFFSDDKKNYRFAGSDIWSVPWKGVIILDDVSYGVTVDGFLFFIRNEEGWFLVDATLPGKFLQRWWRLMSAGVPLATPTHSGTILAPIDSPNAGSFFRITAHDEAVFDLEDLESLVSGVSPEKPTLVEGPKFFGIIAIEGQLSFQEDQEFYLLRDDKLQERSFLRSSRIENYRIKYGQIDYIRFGRFLFRNIKDDGREIIPPEHLIAMADYPPEFCDNPQPVFEQLMEKLGMSDERYIGAERFRITRAYDFPNRLAIEALVKQFDIV